MTHPAIDCARADRDELVARYVSGAMAGEEAEAFEEHYFACEACWAALQRAVELRAAFEAPATVAPEHPAAPPHDLAASRPLARRRSWWPLAAAASVAIAAAAGWRVLATHRVGGAAVDAERGGAAPVVKPRPDTDALALSWSPVPGAASYRVRLFTPDGAVLLDREVADTMLVPAAAVAGAAPDSRVFWQVEALNGVRDVIARSALTAARVPAAPR